MIKKIFIFLFITVLLSSCGKKGDPIYKNSEKKAFIQSYFLNKA